MTKEVIYITRKIPEELLTPYKNKFEFKMWNEAEIPVPKAVLSKEAKRASGLLCVLSDKIDAEFLEENRHLKIIANLAVGFDNIDIDKANSLGITITNTPDVLTETTADLTFSLLMATARRLIEANNIIVEDKWQNWSPFMMAGSDIYNKTIGIVGMGRIGEAVARRAKGFNMDVLYYNRNQNIAAEEEIGAKYKTFDDLIEQADFIVSLVPLTEETFELFDEIAFKKMKQTAVFINVSRGAVVNEDALYNALKTGEITAAGLDVFKEEPIAASHRFVGLKNAVLLPHIGSASVATRTNMIQLCLENIGNVLNGKVPKTEVK